MASPVEGVKTRALDPDATMPPPTAHPHNLQGRRIVELGRRHTFYVNERGERFNLVALHRMNMQYLRMRLVDEAVDIFQRGDMDDENSRKVTRLMQDYCKRRFAPFYPLFSLDNYSNS